MAVLGVTTVFNSGDAIVASEMNDNFDDIEAFVNTTPGLLQLDGGTITGAIQLNNTLTLGGTGAGHDVKLWGDTTGDYFEWDADTNKLVLEGTNGTTALDVTDGNVVIGDGTLTVSGDLVVDTNCLYVDVSENRVGINTASPVLTGLTIGRQPSDANEGGQINFEGGTSYSNNLSFDRYGNDLRFIYNTAVVGQWSSVGTLNIYDAGQLILGTGSDLKVYANGSHSFIDHDGDGNFYIRARGTDEDMYIDAKDNLNLQTNSTTIVRVQPNGDVAFGTTRAGVGHRQYYNLLFPRGGINYSQTNGQDQVWLCSNATVDTGSGWDYINDGPAGLLGVDDGDAVFHAAVDGLADGNISWVEAFRVTNVGVLTCASTKSFDIPHPIKGGNHRLRHYDTEGPRPDLIYRGTATLSGGTATVDLDTESDMTDGTWEALCTNPWALVASSGNAVEWSLSGKTLTITSDTVDAVCSWMVIGERNDANVGTITTEYEKDGSDPFAVQAS